VPTPAPEKPYTLTVTFGGISKETAEALSKNFVIKVEERK
jgi:hypothetical protein